MKSLDERCRDEDVVIVCGIKPKRLRWLLNNSRHDVDNFCPDYVRKTLRSNPTAIGAFSRYDSNNALALMTVIEGYGPGTYLHEMTGFVKGGGKQLVDAVISKYKAVWGQVAQVQENGNGKCLGTNQDLLNKFYMKIPALKFYSVENSVFDGAEATFFYTGIADAEFAKFCEDSFGKAGLNESSAGFERIDDITAFLDGKNPAWERVVKFQRVNARQSAGGEKIRTVGSDGNAETERTTSAGDWVVNNVETPDNVWIIDDATFRKKYEQDGDGVYKPRGGAMMAVPVASCCATGVEFAPPKWGGDVIRIQNDGYFMKDPTDGTDIYAVSKADFDSTYRPEGRLDEQRFSPKDAMNWEAHGRDPRHFPSARKISPNMHALTAELKQKFRGQFKDVRLTDLGGTWKAEFSVENLQSPVRGQRAVKEVVPRIDDIVRLLRIRGIETNQYDISAVPVGLNESAPVVSDQTIDSFSASYYCIFGDPDFRAKVDEIRNSEKYRQMGRGAI